MTFVRLANTSPWVARARTQTYFHENSSSLQLIQRKTTIPRSWQSPCQIRHGWWLARLLRWSKNQNWDRNTGAEQTVRCPAANNSNYVNQFKLTTISRPFKKHDRSTMKLEKFPIPASDWPGVSFPEEVIQSWMSSRLSLR